VIVAPVAAKNESACAIRAAGRAAMRRLLRFVGIPKRSRVVSRQQYGLGRLHGEASGRTARLGDYIPFWKHNGYWLFDSPEVIIGIAGEHGIDLADTVLFFYEVHELAFDSGEWIPFEPVPSFGTNVRVPEVKVIDGYDVVTFALGTSPECSPLSCNSLASKVETNSRCLLQSFEQARKLLEDGTFNQSEPGPHRIFAVYSVPWAATV
jgi:hypothetical protein